MFSFSDCWMRNWIWWYNIQTKALFYRTRGGLTLAERVIFENWSGATLERDRVTIPLVFDCTGTHKWNLQNEEVRAKWLANCTITPTHTNQLLWTWTISILVNWNITVSSNSFQLKKLGLNQDKYGSRTISPVPHMGHLYITSDEADSPEPLISCKWYRVAFWSLLWWYSRYELTFIKWPCTWIWDSCGWPDANTKTKAVVLTLIWYAPCISPVEEFPLF
jgi:hypothetical protein